MKSLLFDIGVSTFSAISYVKKLPVTPGHDAGFFVGMQLFSIATCFDGALQFLLIKEIKEEVTKADHSFINGITSAILEEATYSGILLTRSKTAMIFRFAAVLSIAMPAAGTLVGRAATTSHLTLDTKLAFVWAIVRELLLQTLPESYSARLFIFTDSLVCGLADVSPSPSAIVIPKFSNLWWYKFISAMFFRIIANKGALRAGIAAPITQHLFFNISRSFSE
ncbi:MAG: hypothetical protein L0207_04875 [Chlamydiae bacterium]|nr:hypothetical protein [Chlamydiota bacterium]